MGKPDLKMIIFLFIGKELTWGSETSQYPEEKKTTASGFPFAHYVCANGKPLSRFP
jgi:hypothetical protein